MLPRAAAETEISREDDIYWDLEHVEWTVLKIQQSLELI